MKTLREIGPEDKEWQDVDVLMKTNTWIQQIHSIMFKSLSVLKVFILLELKKKLTLFLIEPKKLNRGAKSLVVNSQGCIAQDGPVSGQLGFPLSV